MTEKTEKIIIKLPWSQIAKLIVTLIKSSKGGISKEECDDLLVQLSEIVAVVLQSMK